MENCCNDLHNLNIVTNSLTFSPQFNERIILNKATSTSPKTSLVSASTHCCKYVVYVCEELGTVNLLDSC